MDKEAKAPVGTVDGNTVGSLVARLELTVVIIFIS